MMDQFTHFPLLPSKVQSAIWSMAVYDYPSRIIELRNSRYGGTPKLPRNPYGTKLKQIKSGSEAADTSRIRIPPLLHACRDARRIARARWTLVFGQIPRSPESYTGKVFFDLVSDVLFFGAWTGCMYHFVTYSCPDLAVREQIKTIAFCPSAEETRADRPLDLEWIITPKGVAARLHRDFPGLQIVYFVWDRQLNQREIAAAETNHRLSVHYPFTQSAHLSTSINRFSEDPEATEIRFFPPGDPLYHEAFYTRYAANKEAWVAAFQGAWESDIAPTVIDVDYAYYRPEEVEAEDGWLKT
ncbi:hypothetical protein F5884DRAFT_338950 [Xylogone sp. PMI_703]|nr:hypothetical protein F5884DRAFT_338950 [Xylogone sp. PMI_703]